MLATVYSGFRMHTPSFWVDEAATISAIDRSLPDLFRMLGNIDAVHGFYYLLVRGWAALFGLSEFALRSPSLIAIGVAAGLVVAIGRRIGSLDYGLTAAALMVLLPRTQYIATDARSYALALAAGVAATYFLVRARELPQRRFWVGYAAAGLLATLLSFYTVLVFVAHAVTVCLDRRLRESWRPFLATSPAWLIPTACLAVIGTTQQFQIAWIRPIDGGVVAEVALLQFFSDAYLMVDGDIAPLPTPGENLTMIGLAVLLWGMTIVGSLRLRKHFAGTLALPLLVVPLLCVIGGSLLLGSPYYLPRYLSFVLPAVPLLAAAVVLPVRGFTSRGGQQAPSARRDRRAAVGVLAAVAVLALPSYLGQRTEYGRSPEDDFRFVADTIRDETRTGEAVALTVDSGLGRIAYKDSFAGLVDVTVGTSADEWGRIYDQRFELEAVKDEVLPHDVIWVVHSRGEVAPERTLTSLGYRAEERFEGTGSAVVRFVREEP
ncbi:glycosyltransferase family 39 protein [Arthrobacter sp. SX1312]|uniref:glycosyltransferase family 39 protein n=1 Tax=Arthrobacter sp. SX1312 TaxID=2058896 RepID=UPI000CE48692|nr:glycosyltransferase family 39 protein [Arthrobacter sp. SX1312]